jgi:hypothetical protein
MGKSGALLTSFFSNNTCSIRSPVCYNFLTASALHVLHNTMAPVTSVNPTLGSANLDAFDEWQLEEELARRKRKREESNNVPPMTTTPMAGNSIETAIDLTGAISEDTPMSSCTRTLTTMLW